MESSGGFEVHCCSFFVEIRTPVRRGVAGAGRTFEKQRRFPPAKNQLPSCRVRRQAEHASRAGFSRRQGRVAAREFGCKCWVEWSAGNAMRHQRCAGCLGGKAEFPVV